MLNIIHQPLSLGTEGLAGALCATRKTKERRRAGEGEGERSPEQVGFGSQGSKADPLRKARRGLGATGERAFPAETWDEAELWTAPRERDSWRPGSSRFPAPS